MGGDDVETGSQPKDTDNLLGPAHLGPDVGTYQLMEEFSQPNRIKHPLDEPVLISVVRSGMCYLVGLLVSVPVILLTLILVVVTLPLRIVWYVLVVQCFRRSSAHKESLCRLIFGTWTHCDSIWPLSSSFYPKSGPSNGTAHGDGDSFGSAQDSIGAAHHSSASSLSHLVSPASVAHCLVTLQGTLDVADVREIVQQKVVEAINPITGKGLFPRFLQRVVSSCQDISWYRDTGFSMDNHVLQYRPGRHDCQVNTLDDLEYFLNDLAHKPLPLSRPLWEVLVLSDFGDTRCTLLVFRIHSLLTETLCLPRLLCRLNDSELAFVNEPRLDPSFYQRAWGMGQTLSLSMMELPGVFFRRPTLSIWSHIRSISNAQAQQALASHPSATAMAGDSVQRPVSVVTTNCSISQNPKNPIRPANSSSSLTHVRHVLTWARVPNVDQLLRAEKLLHCSVEELFLSFIAGAYNRHLKNNGIRHPPDMYASLPVSLDKWGCSSPDRECCQCLVPVRLPVGVEGAIPRLWEVQKCLEDALDGSLPYSLFSLTYALEHSIIPQSLATKMTKCVLNRAHAASGCVVTFLRGSLGSACNIPPPTPNRSSTPGLFSGMLAGAGTSFTASGGQSGMGGRSEFSLKTHRIHSALFFQPLPSHVNASFTFVVFGREILLSLSTDASIFPSADALLVSFQDQIQKLLRQVSGRMISPIAAQLIAAAKPIIAAVSTSSSDSEVSEDASSGEEDYHPARENPENHEHEARKKEAVKRESVEVEFASAVSTLPSQDAISPVEPMPGPARKEDFNDLSLEQLEVVFSTVQTELERIRNNPYAHRHSSLVRLAGLEAKMEALQGVIGDKLGSMNEETPPPARRSSDRLQDSPSRPQAIAQVHRNTVNHSVVGPEDDVTHSSPNLQHLATPSRSVSMPHPLLNVQQSTPPARTPCITEESERFSTHPVNMLEAFMKSATQDTTRRHSFDAFVNYTYNMNQLRKEHRALRARRSRRLSTPQAVVNSVSSDDILLPAPPLVDG